MRREQRPRYPSKEKLDGIKEKFPGRLRVVYEVSDPVDDVSPCRRKSLTRGFLEEVLGGTRKEDTELFVCGPPAMAESLVGTRRGVWDFAGVRV